MKLFLIILTSFCSLISLAQTDSVAKIFEPGIISTGEYESHPCFTPDGNTMYFVKSTPNFSFWTICVSKKINGKWTKPEVAPFSGQYRDADPFITKDGKYFYFISNRPVDDKEKPDMDIWVMEKTSTGWSQPKNAGNVINSERNEWYPTIAANGNLYFGSERANGKGNCDLYKCVRQGDTFKEAENLGDSVNTRFNEFEPYISPDEKFLVFMAFSPGSFGGSDLFISFNQNGMWSKAKNLGEPFSSGGNEYSPMVSHDNKYFCWASARSTVPSKFDKLTIESYKSVLSSPGNGLGDIYFIPADFLYKRMNGLK